MRLPVDDFGDSAERLLSRFSNFGRGPIAHGSESQRTMMLQSC